MSGGLHGVGASVVNALSEWLEVQVKRNGHIYQQRYERGKICYDLKIVGDCDIEDTGTQVTFLIQRFFRKQLYLNLIFLCTD